MRVVTAASTSPRPASRRSERENEAVWGSGDPDIPPPGGAMSPNVLVFEVPASGADPVVRFQFTAGGVAQAAAGVCREAYVWYAARVGGAPPPDQDLVSFDVWGEPITSLTSVASRSPGCGSATGRQRANDQPHRPVGGRSIPGRTDGLGDSWVVLEDGHACPDPAACMYRAVEIRPIDGGIVGRDWALPRST